MNPNEVFPARGQVMLVTVLALSGTILGATTIAGLLMLYQVRQSTDVVSSSKAIFAADSGLEWQLYKFYKAPDPDTQTCNTCEESDFACPEPEFENGATFKTTCDLKTVGVTKVATIKSSGRSGNNTRSFQIILTQ